MSQRHRYSPSTVRNAGSAGIHIPDLDEQMIPETKGTWPAQGELGKQLQRQKTSRSVADTRGGRPRSEGTGLCEASKEGGLKSMRKGKSPQVERWIMNLELTGLSRARSDEDPL